MLRELSKDFLVGNTTKANKVVTYIIRTTTLFALIVSSNISQEEESSNYFLHLLFLQTMSLVFNLDVVVKEENPEVTLAQILNVPDFVENHLDIDMR